MRMALEINDTIFANQLEVLSALASMDSALGQRLRECVFRELKNARNRIVGGIKFANGDPRGTARAVKRYVARKYLGGVVSILDGKGGGGVNTYEPPRRVYPGPGGQRGGNRMIRGTRTQEIMSYGGADRGFILRFVNSGTHPRYAAGRNGKWGKSGNSTFAKLQEQGTWYRGSISARNFFGTVGAREMQTAVENLGKMIDEEFEKVFK